MKIYFSTFSSLILMFVLLLEFCHRDWQSVFKLFTFALRIHDLISCSCHFVMLNVRIACLSSCVSLNRLSCLNSFKYEETRSAEEFRANDDISFSIKVLRRLPFSELISPWGVTAAVGTEFDSRLCQRVKMDTNFSLLEQQRLRDENVRVKRKSRWGKSTKCGIPWGRKIIWRSWKSNFPPSKSICSPILYVCIM